MPTVSFVVSVLAMASVATANLLAPQEVPVFSNTTELYERLKIMDNNLREVIETVMKYALPTLIRANSQLNISSECSDAVLKLVFGVQRFKPWAFQMLDATAKLPSGLLTGTHSDLGAYDQCVAIKVNDDYAPDQVLFRGQYCMVHFHFLLPPKPRTYKYGVPLKIFDNYTTDNFIMKSFLRIAHFGYFVGLKFGACIPSVCSKDDLTQILQVVPLGLPVSVRNCEVEKEIHVTPVEAIIIFIFCVLGVLMITGTAIEVLPPLLAKEKVQKPKTNPTFAERAINCFSVDSNTTRLLHVEKNNLSVLHGMKFFSITWVIIGHGYLQWNMELSRSIEKIASESIGNFAFQAITNAMLSVDTFFFVTGLLVCYITCKTVEKYGKQAFSIIIFIIHRIARLLPATFGVIGVTLLIPLFGSGPLFHQNDFVVNNCKKTWWANLLFVTNIIEPRTVCLPHTWYTSADMQFYLLSSIFFILLFRKPLFAFVYLSTLIIASMITSAVVNVVLDLPPSILMSEPDVDRLIYLWKVMQFLPHTHLPPYFIGTAVGYLLYKKPKFNIHPVVQLIGWILAAACSMAALYTTYLWNGNEYATVTEAALYAPLHRPAWTVGLAWMVIMCATGRGGFINRFLSWNALVPLSRLTFMAYLLHIPAMWIFMGNMRGPIDAHHFIAVYLIMGHILATFVLSYVCHLVFEAPFARLYTLSMETLLKKKYDNAKAKPSEELPEIEQNGKSISTIKLTTDNGSVSSKL